MISTPKQIKAIKRLILIALVSDDYLFETLVLKGGNALDIAYNISDRGSYDMDFSIEEDFIDLNAIKQKAEALLVHTFSQKEYYLFDFKFSARPQDNNPVLFWGGYQIEFKLITYAVKQAIEGDLERIRREAITFGPSMSTRFIVEISKHEFVRYKVARELEGYTYYVYAPQMIVYEKLRAICQQLAEYANIIPSHKSRARARDFYDIYTVMQHFPAIEIGSPESVAMVREIFSVKEVPTAFIKEVRRNLDFHRLDFDSVRATLGIAARSSLKPFDFYADYVLGLFEPLIF